MGSPSWSWWDSWGPLLVLLLLHNSAPAAAQAPGGASPWQTLEGKQPVVIARGGNSGLFPDSSGIAYLSAQNISLPNVILWCDVQLMKDSVGVCLPDLDLGNSTDISMSSYKRTTYLVNGKRRTGWFTVDYSYDQLSNNYSLIQGIFSRPPNFDVMYRILKVEDIGQFLSPIWLNFQHDLFYSQHKLNVTNYLLSVSRTKGISIGYVSSPEVAFLRRVAAIFRRSQTKFIFRFLERETVEPTTNLTYGSLLKNLTFIKAFASGILIPKNYIWPATADLFLQPHTSIVSDAHKVGLEVFASDFANDVLFAYNYTYSPINEYLSFIDNDNFSVDGILSDHPASASGAVGCLSHQGNNSSRIRNPLVISHNGASNGLPDCTDLAYTQAVKDGANFIDCPVQVTKDGILVCMSSINLMRTTTVVSSPYGTRFSTIPKIQSQPGIYTFNLTWDEIKSLKPTISTPWLQAYQLVRNPANKNVGNFMRLSDFLDFAKTKNISGVLVSVQTAAFFTESLGFNITDSVINALSESGYENQPTLEVMIQSPNSSALIPFKRQTKYKILYKIIDEFYDADSLSLKDIKNFADAVAIEKHTVFPSSQAFVVTQTKLVEKFHQANLSVYTYYLMNEFVSQSWDFYADPVVEIHNLVAGANVDGIITDDPATATLYKRSNCKNYSIPIIIPGDLLSNVSPDQMPPALAPTSPLSGSDVTEPPLPPAHRESPAALSPPPPPSAQSSLIMPSVRVCLGMLLGLLFLIQ